MIVDQPRPFAVSTAWVETPKRAAIALIVSPRLIVYAPPPALRRGRRRRAAGAAAARGELQHLAGEDDRFPAEPVEREHRAVAARNGRRSRSRCRPAAPCRWSAQRPRRHAARRARGRPRPASSAEAGLPSACSAVGAVLARRARARLASRTHGHRSRESDWHPRGHGPDAVLRTARARHRFARDLPLCGLSKPCHGSQFVSTDVTGVTSVTM